MQALEHPPVHVHPEPHVPAVVSDPQTAAHEPLHLHWASAVAQLLEVVVVVVGHPVVCEHCPVQVHQRIGRAGGGSHQYFPADTRSSESRRRSTGSRRCTSPL